jgi:hypothetical protein
MSQCMASSLAIGCGSVLSRRRLFVRGVLGMAGIGICLSKRRSRSKLLNDDFVPGDSLVLSRRLKWPCSEVKQAAMRNIHRRKS